MLRNITEKQQEELTKIADEQGTISAADVQRVINGPMHRGQPTEGNKPSGPYANIVRPSGLDLPCTFRSLSEANIWRVFQFHIQTEILLACYYEPIRLFFPEIEEKTQSKKTNSYTPDFMNIAKTYWEFVEVKGYLDQPSKTKLRRFRNYYPDEFRNTRFIMHSKKDCEWISKLYKGGDTLKIELISGYAKTYKSLVNWQTVKEYQAHKNAVDIAEKQLQRKNPF